MNRYWTLLALALAALALSSCASREMHGQATQKCVDDLLAMIEPHESLLGLWQTGKWRPKEKKDLTMLVRSEFNVGDILSAFPNLELKDGMTLDYVYHQNGMGGWPVLYSRPAESEPFDSYQSLTNAMPSATATAWPMNTWSQGFGFYVDSIRTDGSQEGFFQLITLYLMGDQFFHVWHDGYHDERIICTDAGLNALFTKADGEGADRFGQRIPDTVRRAAHELALSPQVELQSQTVSVSVVIFTKWGGFQRRTYSISREPPHVVLEEQREDLIPYNCGYIM